MAHPAHQPTVPPRRRRWASAATATFLVGLAAALPGPTLARASSGDVLSLTAPAQPVSAGSGFVLTVTATNGGLRDASYGGTVHVTSTDSRATLPQDYTFTASDQGQHSFANVVLATPGTQTITATDSSNSSITGTVSVTVQVGRAAQLVFVNTPPGASPPDAAANTPFSGTLQAEDAAGNIVTTYTGTVSFSSSDPLATLPSPYTFGSADAGSHTFPSAFKLVTVQKAAQTITATDTANSITGKVAIFVSGPARSFGVTIASPGTSGSVVTHAPTTALVQPLDSNGNVAVSYSGTVNFSSSDGQATIGSDASGCTAPCHVWTSADLNGYTVAVTFVTVASSQSLTATDSVNNTITGSGSVAVVAAPASQLVVAGLAGAEAAGSPVPFTVTAEDRYGNVATSYTGTVALTSTDARAVFNQTSFTFQAGWQGTTASNQSLTVTFGTVGTGQTVTATDTANGSITGSQSTNVSAGGPIDHFAVSVPANISAGQSFSITVAALDASGNTSSAFTGTVTLSSTIAGFTPPAPYTFTAGGSGTDNGVHVFSGLSMPLSGQSGTITATDTATPTPHTGTSSLMHVSGTPTHIVFNVNSSSRSVAGTPVGFSFSIEDRTNYVVTNYTGTVHFTSSDRQAVLPSNHTFTTGDCGVPSTPNIDCGRFSFQATLETAGNQTVTAADTSFASPVTGVSGAITVTPAAAVQLVLTCSTSSLTAGTPLSVTVTAEDPYANTATGYTGTVVFSAPSDIRAVLPAAHTFVTSDAGVTTVTVTFETAGNQVLVATDPRSADGVAAGTSPVVPITPAATASFASVGPASIRAGFAFSVTLDAQDQFGNVTPAYSGTVHFTSSDATASLPANYTFTTGSSGDDGVHTFSGVALNTPGAQTVTATDTSTASISGTSTINVAGAATHLRLQLGNTASGAPDALTVTALDANNNVDGGYSGTVHFTSTDSAATLPADYTFTSGGSGSDDGVHTFSVILRTAGTQSVSAADTGNASISGSASVSVTAGAAVSFAVSGPASTVAGGTATISVTAQDASHNTVSTYAGTVRLTSSDPAAVLPGPYTFTTGTGKDNGIHSFSVSFHTSGNRTVTATDASAPSITGTSGSIQVSPGAAAALVVSAPSSAAAGTPFSLSVTADDAYGNVATGYRGTVAFSSNDSRATLPANYSFTATDAGHHVFTVTFKTAGTSSITATDSGSSLSGTTGNIQVAAGPATSLVLNAPSSATAGSPISVSVTLYDAYGNVATGYRGTVAFSSSDSAAALPANYTFTSGDSGSHTFSVTLNRAGSSTVTAGDTSAPTLTSTSGSITVSPGPAATFVWRGAPSNVTSGNSFSASITVTDREGNTVTSYRGTVHFSSSDGSATLPADHTFVAADGGVDTVTVTLRTPGPQTLTATDTATASVTGTSGQIIVSTPPGFNAGAVGSPSVAVTPSQQLVFWQGAGGHLMEAWYQYGWNGPVDVTASAFGGADPLTSAPSVTYAPRSGQQLVFWQGAGGHLFEAWYQNGWNGPVDVTASFFGGAAALSSAPSVTVTATQQLVFWQGAGGHLFEAWYQNGWNGPVDITASFFGGAGALTSSPTVTVTATQQLVFWQGAGGHLFEAWYQNGWNGPVDVTASFLGGTDPATSAPTVTVAGAQQLLFWQGAGGHLFEAWYQNGWNGPVDVTASFFGGAEPAVSAPSVAYTGSQQLLFWEGPGAQLVEAWYQNGWNGPVGLG
ncbi:MAG: beta strand repeat-containing protein [Candidatus Dormibacteria bacterium]